MVTPVGRCDRLEPQHIAPAQPQETLTPWDYCPLSARAITSQANSPLELFKTHSTPVPVQSFGNDALNLASVTAFALISAVATVSFTANAPAGVPLITNPFVPY